MDGKFGYLASTGDFVVAPQYLYAGDFSGGLAVVRMGDNLVTSSYGVIDKMGRPVIGYGRFAFIDTFSDGLAVATTGERNEAGEALYGYIDRDGRYVIKPRFTKALGFADGLAPVRLGDELGYINRQGAIAIKARFKQADGFFDGLAKVTLSDDHEAYVDRTGRVVWRRDYPSTSELDLPANLFGGIKKERDKPSSDTRSTGARTEDD